MIFVIFAFQRDVRINYQQINVHCNRILTIQQDSDANEQDSDANEHDFDSNEQNLNVNEQDFDLINRISIET